jgi:hypothetical protein
VVVLQHRGGTGGLSTVSTTETYKAALLTVYSGDAWKQKVKKMSEKQITAIYLRLKGQGKLS